jgi:membrane protease YdiL (CAAX protease family)
VRSLGLLVLVVGLLAVTAVVSPSMAWGLEALVGRPFTFGRVYDRVLEVLLVAGLAAAWRRLDLGGATSIGLRREGWARRLGSGALIGLAGLAVALVVCGLFGAVEPHFRFAPAKTVRKALLGGGAAVLIGVGEETLFRGILLRRLTRDLGTVAGVAVTTAIYAAVHVLRRQGVVGPIHVWSGVEQMVALLAPLGRVGIRPQLVGLTLLGLVLAAARLRTGSLWVSIGIHAAYVGVFRVGRLLLLIRPEPAWLVGAGWPPLVGGAAGWLGVATTAVLLGRLRGRATA